MKRRLRSIGMVLAFVVGGIFHAEIAPLRWMLPMGITLMLSITFIGLDVRRLRPTRLHLWVLLCLQAMGLGFWYLAYALGHPVLAEALYYCACAPIASACPIIISLLKGDVEFTTTAMVLSQAAFGIVTPFVLPFVVHDPALTYVELMREVAIQMLSVLAAPALLSLVLRLLYPPCREWAPKLRDWSLLIWIVNLTVIAASGTERVVQMNYSWHDIWPMALGAAVVCASGFFFGYWLGYPARKRECSQSLGQKNTILTLYIAGQSYATPIAYVAPVFYVFFHNIANSIQLALAAKEEERRRGSRSDAPPSS